MPADLILPPCNPKADPGLTIMETVECVPISRSNAVTALLETGMVRMVEPITEPSLDTAASLITVKAECSNSKCKTVEFENAPSFVFGLGIPINVPDLYPHCQRNIWRHHVCIRRCSFHWPQPRHHYKDDMELIQLGEEIKAAAVREQFTPVHPEYPAIRGVTNVVFTTPLVTEEKDTVGNNATTVMPGRFKLDDHYTSTSSRIFRY